MERYTKTYLWNDFLKEKAGRKGRVFANIDAEILASWNLCLASVPYILKTGKRFMEKQPKVNISNEASGT